VVLAPRLRDFLLRYAYPGNIRELRNIMYRLSCLAGDTADLCTCRKISGPPPPRAAAGKQAAAAQENVSLADAKRAASDEAERLAWSAACRKSAARWRNWRGAGT
jgi:transcriptional regulator with PAS, ATPase and Fis domain